MHQREGSAPPELGWVASGEVVVDRFNSHLHEEVRPYLLEALARVSPRERELVIEEVDFGRPIGRTICVPTGPGDEIVFARRPGRAGLTRFVKNRAREPCSSVVVILKKVTTGYVLVTAFVGRKPEPEPWDRFATAESSSFWASHALVWGEEVIAGTETTQCQW